MSDSVKEQMDALTGNTMSEIDYKKEYESLKKELQTQRVEHGRLAKANDEIAELKRQIAELRHSRVKEDFSSALTEEERNLVPEEVLAATNKMLQLQQKEYEQRLAELEARNQANKDEALQANREERARLFLAKIDEKFPGFRASVVAGGDKATAWKDYLTYNKASVQSAYDTLDFATFEHHVNQFYKNHLGSPVPTSTVSDGRATPEPQATISTNGKPSSDAPIYTTAEFLALYDKVEDARNRGDWDTYKKLDAELKKAPAEGRVKDA